MTRLEQLKKINNDYEVYHLSKGCFLIKPAGKEIKISTDNEEWKKYIFSFEESKLILNLKNLIRDTLEFKRIGEKTIQISTIRSIGKNKVVYDSVKIKNNLFENVLMFYGILQDRCKDFNLKEIRQL